MKEKMLKTSYVVSTLMHLTT